MRELIPGILEKDWSEIEKKLELVTSVAKSVHIDIIDGVFAPEKTFLDPAPFAQYASTFTLELHMMVKNPISYLEDFAKVGFKRFLGHVEMMEDQEEFVAKAQQFGEVGLALDGETSASSIKVPIEDLDTVLFFTAGKVGRSGQDFMPERLNKILDFHRKHPLLPITIDGGVRVEVIEQACEAGVERFVASSALFHPQDFTSTYHELSQKLKTTAFLE